MWILVDENNYILEITTIEPMVDVENYKEVDNVPPLEYQEGKTCRQKYDEATNRVVNVFEDIQPIIEPTKPPTVEEQLEQIRQDNLTLMKALADIYELLP